VRANQALGKSSALPERARERDDVDVESQSSGAEPRGEVHQSAPTQSRLASRIDERQCLGTTCLGWTDGRPDDQADPFVERLRRSRRQGFTRSDLDRTNDDPSGCVELYLFTNGGSQGGQRTRRRSRSRCWCRLRRQCCRPRGEPQHQDGASEPSVPAAHLLGSLSGCPRPPAARERLPARPRDGRLPSPSSRAPRVPDERRRRHPRRPPGSVSDRNRALQPRSRANA